MNVSVQSNSTFYSNANLDYSIDSASLNNSEELHIRNFQPQIRVRQWQCLQISNWRILKIGLLQECLVVQIQKIPKKVEAILEHSSGDFLVGFITYRGHF